MSESELPSIDDLYAAIKKPNMGRGSWTAGGAAEAVLALFVAAVPRIRAEALREAADELVAYAKDVYWRSDSPFHIDRKDSYECAAEDVRKAAKRIESEAGKQ